MTTASPIPTSIADACAAHDRHRLDVLDALLDEAAPSAVRELLATAADMLATLRADRDALAAKLDAAPKVCAIHSYEHGPGPCMTCGAWPPGTRELIAACQTRIVGLEQSANERSAEVARLTDRVAGLEQAKLCQREAWQRLLDAIDPDAITTGDALRVLAERTTAMITADREVARLTARVVELEAETRVSDQRLADQHDKWTARVAELEARPVLDDEALSAALSVAGLPGGHAPWIMAKLGPVTLAPPAARPVFAGVSLDELCSVYSAAYGERPGHRDDRRPDAIRAVLARLEVSLVTPVDPEEVARDYANNAATGYAPGIDHPPYWFEYTDEQRTKRTAAMRATLIARGIPITPEVGK